MITPPTPHYHVVSPDYGAVWTDSDGYAARSIGRALKAGGSYVEYISCPVGSTCPDEVLYRWETGRAPTPARIKYGHRKPRKSMASKMMS